MLELVTAEDARLAEKYVAANFCVHCDLRFNKLNEDQLLKQIA